jgi:hypothetical protein
VKVVKIGVNELCEGMIVEETVSDVRGTILLQKGTAITQSGIKILKTWGVLEVSIDESSAAEHRVSPALHLDPILVKAVSNETSILFQHADQSNIFVKELMRLATHRIAQSRSESN